MAKIRAFLGITLFSFYTIPMSALAFFDVASTDPNHNIYQHLSDVGVLYSAADGNFYPEKIITRAEALTVALRAGGISINTEFEGETFFDDTDPNAWYAAIIARAIETNILKANYKNFRPLQAVTKAEFLTFLFRATTVDLRPHYSARNVADDIENESWMAPYFDYAKQYQIAHLPTNNLYHPTKQLSRKEVALMTYRQLKLFHGNDETKQLAELQASIAQFLELIQNGKTKEAEFHVYNILKLNERIMRTKNSQDAVATLAISRAMNHLMSSLRNFRYKKNLVAIEQLLLALKQTKKAEKKSVTISPMAQELAHIINETLIGFTNPDFSRLSQK